MSILYRIFAGAWGVSMVNLIVLGSFIGCGVFTKVTIPTWWAVLTGILFILTVGPVLVLTIYAAFYMAFGRRC
ncbi:MAG: hypothetical protein WC910_10705 [Bacteroidales bacterium]|jgi:hypothetical protein